MDDSTYTTAKLQSEARMKWANRSGTVKKDGSFYSMKIQEEGMGEPTIHGGERGISAAKLQKKGTENYLTNMGFALNRGSWDLITEGDKMINEKLEVRVVDNHYHIRVGCQETIVHDKKEALKWLGKLWDEHIKEE
uniref:Uncharacterized protein n=1 Tax=viral metagenome TaxID=1070528 RepID=A0A6M3KEL3_9ZZZZ